MKKYIIMMLTAAALILSGCQKDKAKVDKGIVGEWQLTSWSTEKPELFEVYLNFQSNGTFHIYQKNVTTSFFETFTGTYHTEDGYVYGEYCDGEPWSTRYEYIVSGDKLTLMTDTDLRETSVYTRAEIPAEAKEGKPQTKAGFSGIRAL